MKYVIVRPRHFNFGSDQQSQCRTFLLHLVDWSTNCGQYLFRTLVTFFLPPSTSLHETVVCTMAQIWVMFVCSLDEICPVFSQPSTHHRKV